LATAPKSLQATRRQRLPQADRRRPLRRRRASWIASFC